MSTIHAFCWASGEIEYGTEVPKGAIRIATGPESSVRHLIYATARLAYDNKTMLVPGIPEAQDQKAKVAALSSWLTWLKRRAIEDVQIAGKPA